MSRLRLTVGFLPTSALFLFTVIFALLPVTASAQKREDILSIQRDVAQLQDQIKQMQTSQDQKFAALEGLLKQALEDSNRLTASMSNLERTLTDRLAQQQSKVEAPVAALGSKVDGVSDEVRGVRDNVAALSARMGSLDGKLADISSAIRTLNTPAVAPPPPAAGGLGSPGVPAPPTGVSADILWQNANRDLTSGKDELAMNELSDFVKYFPQSENAPTAQYRIGDIYFRGKQFSDAALAFDAVLERYPENPKTPDSLYMKAAALMAANRRTDASTEFKDFLARYPSHSLAAKARMHLAELGMSTAPAARKKR